MRTYLTIALLLSVFAGTPACHAESAPIISHGEALVGGAFTLTDTHGNIVHDTDFRGKPMLVYLGYSNCPDVCPLTLAIMSRTLQILGTRARHVTMLFITLDPERDTPEVLGKYLENFNAQIIGLTGSRDDINAVIKAYKASANKVTPPHADAYLVEHSGLLYLMDKNGKYVKHFESDVTAETLAAAITRQF